MSAPRPGSEAGPQGGTARGAAEAARADAESEALPARLSIRVTMVLALSFMTVQTVLGSIADMRVLAVLWTSASLQVFMSFYPRIPARVLEWFSAGSWWVVGLAALFESGLRGGPMTLVVALGLFGAFFGVRMAFGMTAISTGAIVLAGVAEGQGWWQPRFGTPGDLVEQWGMHAALFIVMATMLTLTLGATLERARRAKTRARQFALAAEHADRAVLVLDAAGALAWVNDAFTRTTGLTQDASVGRSLAALLASPTMDAGTRGLLAGEGGASARVVELVLQPPDRDAIWARVELRPLGDAPGFSGLILDVTEQHALAELEDVQRTLATSLSRARTTDDAHRALLDALPRASAVLGARLLRVVAGEPTPFGTRISRGTQHPAEALETLLAEEFEVRDEGTVDMGRASRPAIARLGAGAVPHTRARFRVEGPTPGWLEVIFAVDRPGRVALLPRIPELVDQLVRHEQRLDEQARFEALFDRSPDALVLLDDGGRVTRANLLACALWPALAEGSTAAWPGVLSEAVDAVRKNLQRDTAREVAFALDPSGNMGDPAHSSQDAWVSNSESSRLSTSDSPRALEYDSRRPGARLPKPYETPPKAPLARDLEAIVAPIPLPEGRGVLVSVRDVSARRAAERSLEHALIDMRAALDEREVLLKEIHHRVKNNLQIVSSLLSMQSDRSASDEARAALEQSVHRVRSMALIHQQLYGGDDLARVELSDYVRTLVTELRSALAPTAEVVFDITPTEVEVETAIPCGLILNELVVNAFKHGCDAGGRCRVHITLDREDGRVRLGVADAGPGVPPGFDVAKLRRATSLGMRLIAALTQQISATLRLDAGPGARFSLVLSAEPVQRTAHPSLRAPSQRP